MVRKLLSITEIRYCFLTSVLLVMMEKTAKNKCVGVVSCRCCCLTAASLAKISLGLRNLLLEVCKSTDLRASEAAEVVPSDETTAGWLPSEAKVVEQPRIQLAEE